MFRSLLSPARALGALLTAFVALSIALPSSALAEPSLKGHFVVVQEETVDSRGALHDDNPAQMVFFVPRNRRLSPASVRPTTVRNYGKMLELGTTFDSSGERRQVRVRLAPNGGRRGIRNSLGSSIAIQRLKALPRTSGEKSAARTLRDGQPKLVVIVGVKFPTGQAYTSQNKKGIVERAYANIIKPSNPSLFPDPWNVIELPGASPYYITIDRPSESPCTGGRGLYDIKTAVQDKIGPLLQSRGYTLQDVYRLMIAVPYSCGTTAAWGEYSSVRTNGAVTWFFNTYFNDRLVPHELGHNFGFTHTSDFSLQYSANRAALGFTVTREYKNGTVMGWGDGPYYVGAHLMYTWNFIESNQLLDMRTTNRQHPPSWCEQVTLRDYTKAPEPDNSFELWDAGNVYSGIVAQPYGVFSGGSMAFHLRGSNIEVTARSPDESGVNHLPVRTIPATPGSSYTFPNGAMRISVVNRIDQDTIKVKIEQLLIDIDNDGHLNAPIMGQNCEVMTDAEGYILVRTGSGQDPCPRDRNTTSCSAPPTPPPTVTPHTPDPTETPTPEATEAPTATPASTATPVCTPPPCPGGWYICNRGFLNCWGGCGVICVTPPPDTLTPLPSATFTPTPRATFTPTATATPTAPPKCTAVSCPFPGTLICPPGVDCQGGCGLVCSRVTPTVTATPTSTPTATPTPTDTPLPPSCTPVRCEAPARLICPAGRDCSGGCNKICVEPGEPVVRRQPVERVEVREGETIRIAGLAVRGERPFTYSWKNGSEQARGTHRRPVLRIRRARLSDAGSYTCTVSNSHGAVTTRATVVTVVPATVNPTPTRPATPGPRHRMFVSSSSHAGDFGGFRQADGICQDLAAAASLGGSWKAIVSGPNRSARERISIGGPVVDVRDRLIASDAADLWDGTVQRRVDTTERGERTSQVLVWTGTRADGSRDSRAFSTTCEGWQSNTNRAAAETGRTDRADFGWIAIYDEEEQPSNACSNRGALYCIEQFDALPAHRIFVTSSSRTGDMGGLAGADAACNEAARSADLGGQWKAIISDRTVDARDRLSIIGRVVDLDGRLIASGPGDLWDGSVANEVAVTERRRPSTQHLVWSATRPDGTRDRRIGANACGDWRSASGGVETGSTDRRDFGWLSIYDEEQQAFNACSNLGALYCLEQFNESMPQPRD